jgi:hypothetical protein
VLIGFVLVVVAAAGGVAYAIHPRGVPPTYVTDGSFVFDANVSNAETTILRENQRVTGTHRRFVTIGFVFPASPPDRSRHALEGAYVAQYEANHGTGAGPLVRLELARDTPWQPTATALTRAHPTAVAGFAAEDTKLEQALTAARIPTISAMHTDTAATVSIAPPFEDETVAAIRFLNGNPDPRHRLPVAPRMWVVQDRNDADFYASALGTGFTQVLKDDGTRPYQIVGPGSEYDSGVPAAATVLAASVTQGGADVCRTHVDVVYFAGRATDLAAALGVLARRPCAASQPLTVLTGSDAMRLAGHPVFPATANLDVLVTALTQPGGLPTFGHFFPKEPATAQDDGWVILCHDSVLAARTPAPPAANPALPIVRLGADGSLAYLGTSTG